MPTVTVTGPLLIHAREPGLRPPRGEFAVAVRGDVAVSGSRLLTDEQGNQLGGAVDVFRRTAAGWAQLQHVMPNDSATWDDFGRTVAFDGATLVVGAPLAPGGGRVTVFRNTGTWVQISRLAPPQPLQSDDRFGASLAVDGDWILVGAPGRHTSYGGFHPLLTHPGVRYGSGAAYLYRREGEGSAETWRLVGESRLYDVADRDGAGSAVALSADLGFALLGAPAAGSYVGAAFLVWFDDTGVYERARFTTPGNHPKLFGQSVAVDGGWLLVGAPWDGPYGVQLGRVHAFAPQGDGFALQQELVDPRPRRGDQFGESLAARDGRLLVGAPGDRPLGSPHPSSAVEYQLRDGQWRFVARIESPAGAGFGRAVALDGPVALVSRTIWERGPDAGWSSAGDLVAQESSVGDRFGQSLATSADLLVVGASSDDAAGQDSGAAYVYRRTAAGGFAQLARLTDPVAGTGAAGGHAVAVDGATVAVGGPYEGAGTLRPGAVTVFRFDGAAVVEQSRLGPPAGHGDGFFGTALALSGDTLAVGARIADAAGSRSGAVYVFRRSDAGWALHQTLTAPDPQPNAFFGCAVALSGNVLAIGANGRTGTAGGRAGAVYVATRTGERWAVGPPVEGAVARASLGTSVACTATTVVAGAPGGPQPFPAAPAGSVSVLGRAGDGWLPVASLTAGSPGDRLGTSVAVGPGWIAVGDRSGVLVHTTAELTADPTRLPLPRGAAGFGGALAGGPGRELLVGARSADSAAGVASGAVFRFEVTVT
jgi:hypothetical protein